ncbi:MAG TPA: ABC transporter permease subunit [Thermomicrobiales bacterium]|nr:ABC transporter permease subunit [Thermomicrobiales bacterium]
MDKTIVAAIATKEARIGLRNRWFAIYTILFSVLIIGFVAFALSGSNLTGQAGFGRTSAGLLNLLLLMVPLIALTIGAQLIASERQDRSLDYLLAQPLTALEVYVGKFIGAAISLMLMLLIGFGGAGAVMAFRGGAGGAGGFLMLVALTLMLGLAMLSVGYLISSFSRQTAAALGIALTLWLMFVIAGDLGIMGSSMVLGMSPETLLSLTALNPLNVYKMASVDLLHTSLDVLGPAGIYAVDQFGSAFSYLMLGLLALWILVPLPIGYWLFKRTDFQ